MADTFLTSIIAFLGTIVLAGCTLIATSHDRRKRILEDLEIKTQYKNLLSCENMKILDEDLSKSFKALKKNRLVLITLIVICALGFIGFCWSLSDISSALHAEDGSGSTSIPISTLIVGISSWLTTSITGGLIARWAQK